LLRDVGAFESASDPRWERDSVELLLG